MKAKHTPGQWIAVGRYVEHVSDKRADICNCDPASMEQDGRSDGEICANARLIAAAPEMLEALYAAGAQLLVFQVAHPSGGLSEVIQKVELVMSKATGEPYAN